MKILFQLYVLELYRKYPVIAKNIATPTWPKQIIIFIKNWFGVSSEPAFNQAQFPRWDRWAATIITIEIMRRSSSPDLRGLFNFMGIL